MEAMSGISAIPCIVSSLWVIDSVTTISLEVTEANYLIAIMPMIFLVVYSISI